MSDNAAASGKLSYIPALDGLRAVAVILVLLFHAQLSMFGGGYLGVDIFFCISGYIITLQILRQMDENRFHLGGFWLRRIARLFPALLVVVGLTLLCGAIFLSEPELRRLGGASLSNLFYVSNFFFWNESGYFDADAVTKPLLHTWSLAVEEQFYIFWPLLLMAAYAGRSRKAVIYGVAIASALSGAAATFFAMQGSTSAVFYMMPFRVFQFGAGALVAIMLGRKVLPFGGAISLLSLGALIAVSMVSFVYTGPIYAQGLIVSVLCVGFFVGMSSPLMTALVGNSVMTFIGRRSYSIYLVHWPIFVFYILRFGTDVSLAVSFAGIVISLIVGSILYTVIETPIRFGRQTTARQKSRRLTLIGVMAGTLLAGGLSVLWVTGSDRPSTGFEQSDIQVAAPDNGFTSGRTVKALLDTEQDQKRRVVDIAHYGKCFFIYKGQYTYRPNRVDFDLCVPNLDTKYNIIVIGDSSGTAVYMALKELEQRLPIQAGYLGMAGCSPLLEDYVAQTRQKECGNFHQQRMDYLRQSDLDAIVLSGNWNDQMTKQLGAMIESLTADFDVFVIGETPRFGESTYTHLSRFDTVEAANADAVNLLENGREPTVQRNEELQQIVTNRNAQFWDVFADLCSEDDCPVTTFDGQNMRYLDKFHMSESGAKDLADLIEPQLKKALPE